MTTAIAFDTETTDKWNFKAKMQDPSQPGLVQLGFRLLDLEERKPLQTFSAIIKPGKGYTTIDPGAAKIHGISVDKAVQYGMEHDDVVRIFLDAVLAADIYVCHNADFDSRIVSRACWQANKFFDFKMNSLCTMKHPKVLKNFGPKWPKLIELHEKLLGVGFDGAHDALEDILATERCLYGLLDKGILTMEDF